MGNKIKWNVGSKTERKVEIKRLREMWETMTCLIDKFGQ